MSIYDNIEVFIKQRTSDESILFNKKHVNKTAEKIAQAAAGVQKSQIYKDKDSIGL